MGSGCRPCRTLFTCPRLLLGGICEIWVFGQCLCQVACRYLENYSLAGEYYDDDDDDDDDDDAAAGQGYAVFDELLLYAILVF